MYMYIYTCIHVCVYMYMCMYIYMYIHTHTCTYKQELRHLKKWHLSTLVSVEFSTWTSGRNHTQNWKCISQVVYLWSAHCFRVSMPSRRKDRWLGRDAISEGQYEATENSSRGRSNNSHTFGHCRGWAALSSLLKYYWRMYVISHKVNYSIGFELFSLFL